MQPVYDHTLTELQIIPDRHQHASLLNYFDKTKSPGGRSFLKKVISTPKGSLDEVIATQELLKLIGSDIASWEISVARSYILAAQNYCESNISHTPSQDVFQHWLQTLIFSYRNPTDFYHIQSGLAATLATLACLRKIISHFDSGIVPEAIKADIDFTHSFLNSPVLKPVLTKHKRLSKKTIFFLDYYFRNQHKKTFQRLLDLLYQLDAYVSIVKTTQENQLCFPEFTSTEGCFEATDLWHPLLSNPVKNDFSLSANPPVCLLTGANTSGKTSFLKATGIAVYLAHLGWPVPAASLRISHYDHLITSLHLSDDLERGYSHFYNEMMRIKSVAEVLNRGESCFVLVDELFRGTNQEDAVHCSKVVLDGFAQFDNSIFLISTHIQDLLNHYEQSKSVCFYCFKTILDGNDFKNTYRLEAGIATEKIGKLILQKTGIHELLSKTFQKNRG